MNVEELCHALGLTPEEQRILEPYQSLAEESLPENIEFLTPEFVEEFYPLLTWDDPSLKTQLLATASDIEKNPALRFYTWLLHRAIATVDDAWNLGKLPELTTVLGERAGLLQLLVAMSMFPLIRQTLQRLGLPPEQLNGIANWVRGTISIYASAHHGLPGHTLSQTSWMRYYIKGELFRIGRFEYLIHETPDWLPAIYRHRTDKRVVALCRNGWTFDQEGLKAKQDKAVFTATLEARDGKVIGTPIAPDGYVQLNKEIALSETDWEPVLTPWEWVPSIHIPGGGGMKPELVMASLREAKAFFRRYFHRDIRMFCCNSWILNPDWERELPESNMTKFRRMLYAFTSWNPTGMDGLFFVFGRSDQDWSNYPEDNSLRRAFHRLRRCGRPLRSGAGFVLTEDLERMEEDYYRNRAGWQD